MKNWFLLPHYFKKTGMIIFPIGFLVWLLVQLKVMIPYAPAAIKTVLLTGSACTFVFGFFFAVFSKERIEDEFISQKRMETLFISALIQVILIITGFFAIGLGPWPQTIENQMFYFLGCIFVFYLSYIIRFNYVLYKRCG
jgi:hypothetical protein